jgi:L-lactate dehydrogenase complex protein LldG
MEREAFLDRVAARLGRPRLSEPPARAADGGVPEGYRTAPLGADGGQADRIERFRTELEALGGHLIVAGGVAEAGAALQQLLDELTPRTILTWSRTAFAGWGVDWLWDERGAVAFVESSSGPSREDLHATAARADVGITTVDFAVVNTGTIALATTPERARSVSLLPTVHVALVRESRLVDRLGPAFEAYAAIPAGETPSSVHFISGPSRSADIENDLSIGVHGPAALWVIVRRGA